MKITISKTITDAVAKQWPAVAAIVAIGVVTGILVGLYAPMSQTYLATSSVSIGKAVVTGVDMPCTPGTMPALARGDAVADDLKRLDVGLGVPPGASVNGVQAQLAGDVLQIHDVAPSAPVAQSIANQVASSLQTFCRKQTVEAWTAFNAYLTKQIDETQKHIIELDVQLIPASDTGAERAALIKQRNDLQAKVDTLKVQQSLEKADASAKRQAQDALAPAARAFIQNSDARYKTLKTQLDTDSVAYATMQSQYQKTYPGLAALKARVDADQSALTDYEKVLAKEPLELDPAYRAAKATADQAQATLVETGNQLAATQQTLDGVTQRIVNPPPPKSKAEIAALTRERAEAVKQYQALSARLATAQTEEALIPAGGPVTIVAVPVTPDATRIGLLVAVLLGLLTLLVFVVLAVLIAMLLNMDRRLLTIQSITKLYGKPVIATVRPQKRA